MSALLKLFGSALTNSAQLAFDFHLSATIVDAPIAVASGTAILPPKPIEYTLIVSARARQVYLRVEPGRGLLVTIPKRFSRRAIPEIIEAQRQWISASLADIDARTPERYRRWPPETLDLLACARQVELQYIASKSPATKINARWVSASKIVLTASAEDRAAVASGIALLLKAEAKSLLTPWINRLACQHNLTFKRLAIRGQRTLWGSFSSSGTLSLNYKLLFLRPEMVTYVLLHELAHTRHLDHSPLFWRFLDGMIPGARALDAELANACTLVPPWLELAT